MIKMSKSKYCKFLTLYSRLEKLSREFEDDNDISLNYGNGSVHLQLSCALASFECIYQEL